MAFHIYTGNLAERLVERLAEEIREKPLPVFQDDIVVVQSKGMERWLKLEIARINGICTNISFPFPRLFFYNIFRQVVGIQDEYLFAPEILQWKIMNILPHISEVPEFRDVKNYIQGENPELKLFQLSEKLAHLFDQYLIFRPDMILRWETDNKPFTPGFAHEKWQAELWRHLSADSKGLKNLHPPALKKLFMEKISLQSQIKGLPPRIFVFGISSLPPFYMEILKRVSEQIEVHFFYQNPCREYWEQIRSEKNIASYLSSSISDQELYFETGNSLLASMGLTGREFFGLIMTMFEGNTGIDLFEEPSMQNMLSSIQSAILNLHNQNAPARFPEDRSIEIHCCYSPMREVEALYDNLLGIFDENEDITPRDVLVMLPDIASYVPLIKAVFDTPEDESLKIPYSISDRSLNTSNPAAETLMKILLLDQNRFKATEVFDILSHHGVYKKFGLELSDIETAMQWVSDAAIRWAIDEDYKKQAGMPAHKENTWQFGMNRLIMGYAMSTDEQPGVYCDITPCAEFEAEGSHILGSLNTFIQKLVSWVLSLRKKRSVESWAQDLLGLLADFFSEDMQKNRDLQSIRDAIIEISKNASLAGFNEPVGMDIICTLLRRFLETTTSTHGFISRGVTFCTLLPMRSIPFKVIYLMGMNDSAYPRKTARHGFDITGYAKRLCDPDKRSEDKYLFLEALLSARKHLFISYVGRSVKENSEIMPSMLVQELCDHIKRAFGEQALEAMIVNHPLQPFSPKYFNPDKQSRIFSFSKENFAAAERSVSNEKPPQPFITGAFEEADRNAQRKVNLLDLIRFFRNPSEYFLKNSLSINFIKTADELTDEELFELDNLDIYSLQEELIDRIISGKDPAKYYKEIKAEGRLPQGGAGKEAFQRVSCFAGKCFKNLKPYIEERIGVFEKELEFSGIQTRVFVRFENVFARGQFFFRPASIKVKDRLKGWIFHLALNAMENIQYSRTTTVMGTDAAVSFPEVDKISAKASLETLLKLYFKGTLKPLCFFPETSFEFAKKNFKGKEAKEALSSASRKWANDYLGGESDDIYIFKCFGSQFPETDDFMKIANEIFTPMLLAGGK